MATVTEQINPTNIPTTITGEDSVTSEESREAATAAEKNQKKGPPKKVEYPGLEFQGEGDDKKVRKLKAIPGLFSKDNADGFNPDKHKLLVAKYFNEPYLVENHKSSVLRWRADKCDEEAEVIKKGGTGIQGQRAIANALGRIKEFKGDMSSEEFKAEFPDIAELLDGLV